MDFMKDLDVFVESLHSDKTLFYDIVVRTVDKGYLAFEYRVNANDLDKGSHAEIKKDPRYLVSSMTPVLV